MFSAEDSADAKVNGKVKISEQAKAIAFKRSKVGSFLY
jgi:hypothetical protein